MENQPIEIRRLTEEDAQVFYQLRLEALEKEPGAFSESPEEHRTLTIGEIGRRLGSSAADDSSFVLGALVSDRLVGMAGFYQERGLKNRHKGRIWGVYVNKDWRGKGIGRVLLSELIQRTRSRPGLKQISLAVSSEQIPAKKLYQSLGFEVYGREPRAIQQGNSYFDEDLMLLHLDT